MAKKKKPKLELVTRDTGPREAPFYVKAYIGDEQFGKSYYYKTEAEAKAGEGQMVKELLIEAVSALRRTANAINDLKDIGDEYNTKPAIWTGTGTD